MMKRPDFTKQSTLEEMLDHISHKNQSVIKSLTKILHAAHHAPSVGFSQPWNFILIKDTKTKQKIKESFQKEHKRASELVEDPKRTEYLSLKLEGIMESDVNVCVTYDPTKFGPFIIGTTSIPEAGIYSVCCAIQNLWLAARAENIGLGWVSIVSNDVLREQLEFTKTYRTCCISLSWACNKF